MQIYTKLVSELTQKISLPISYYWWEIAGLESGRINDIPIGPTLTTRRKNPLLYLEEVRKRRKIIRKILRIV